MAVRLPSHFLLDIISAFRPSCTIPWLPPCANRNGYWSLAGTASALEPVGTELQVWTWQTDCGLLAESRTHRSLALSSPSLSLFCFQLFHLEHTQPMNHCLVTHWFPGRLEEAHWIKPLFFSSFPFLESRPSPEVCTVSKAAGGHMRRNVKPGIMYSLLMVLLARGVYVSVQGLACKICLGICADKMRKVCAWLLCRCAHKLCESNHVARRLCECVGGQQWGRMWHVSGS